MGCNALLAAMLHFPLHTVKVDSILPKSLTLNAVFTQGRGSMSSRTFEEFHPVRSTQRLRLASFLSLHKLLQRKLCYDGLFLGTRKINLLWWSGYKSQLTTGKGFVIKQCATVHRKEPKQPQNSRLDSCVIFTLFSLKVQWTEMRSASASVCSDQGETP